MMMRLIVIAITATFAITGCDSDHDRMIKVMEKQIRDTIEVDWSRDGIHWMIWLLPVSFVGKSMT